MEKFSDNQIAEFLRQIGVPETELISKGKVVNIFNVLKIKPKINEDGTREKTPYEILRVPPKFENGREVPIIFSIKNRVKKIGKYEGKELNFFFKTNKIKKEKDILETLKQNYRQAIFYGDEELAAKYMSMIESISSADASSLETSFFNYNKYYRRMKKQLLIDLFAHFFVMYLAEVAQYKEEKKRTSVANQPEQAPKFEYNPEDFGLENIEKISYENDSQVKSIDFEDGEQISVLGANTFSSNRNGSKTIEGGLNYNIPVPPPPIEFKEEPKKEVHEEPERRSLYPNLFRKKPFCLFHRKRRLRPKFFNLFDNFEEENNIEMVNENNQVFAGDEEININESDEKNYDV